MKTTLSILAVAAALLLGCGAIPPEKTRTLKMDVTVSDDHTTVSVRNNGQLTLARIEVYLYTRDQHRYIFRFPPDTTLPPGKTASFLLSNLQEENTHEAFTHWDQIHRITVHTPTEYWSGGGDSR